MRIGHFSINAGIQYGAAMRSRGRRHPSSIAGILLAGLAAATLALGGMLPAPPAAAAESVVRIGNGGEPQTLDPHRYNLRLEETILTDLFQGLTAMDASGRIVPGAAESWQVSADGLRWTFRLKPGQTWSDGRPLTAEDFVFSFRRLLSPATGASLAYFMYPLKNAQAVNGGSLPPDALGVRAPDPQTLVVDLERPYPHLPERLLYPTAFPVPAHTIAELGDAWVKAEHWVSNGAYLLGEWRPQGHVRLVANPRFRPQAQIQTVYYHPLANEQNAYNRYRTGELHAIGGFPANELAYIERNMAEHLRVSPLLSMIYLVFNTRRPPFDDPRVREALALVVQPELLTDKVQRTGNYPVRGFVPALVAGYRPVEPQHHHLSLDEREARARELLREAGYGSSNPLQVTLRYFQGSDAKRTNLAIASFWKRIGVTTELHHSELKVHFADLRQGDFQVAQAGWIGENNPAHYLELLASDAGSVNYGRYHDPVYDQLLAEARQQADLGARYALFRQAELRMLAHHPVVPLWSVASKRLVHPELEGWQENLRDVHPARFLSW